MDQTINVMYKARIANAMTTLNEYANGKKSNEGTIIASDETAYKKVGGRLVMASPDKKSVKFLNAKLAEYGLYKPAQENVTEAEVAHSTTEMVAEL